MLDNFRLDFLLDAASRDAPISIPKFSGSIDQRVLYLLTKFRLSYGAVGHSG
jgi:hypothetical protein